MVVHDFGASVDGQCSQLWVWVV